jgi:hypothetical protein
MLRDPENSDNLDNLKYLTKIIIVTTMDKKERNEWFLMVWKVIILGLLSFAAYKVLNMTDPTFEQIAKHFSVGGILMLLYFVFNIITDYDLSTVLSLGLIAISLVVFYYGMVEKSVDKKLAMLTFAGSIFGLGSGIPIGKAFSNKNINL